MKFSWQRLESRTEKNKFRCATGVSDGYLSPQDLFTDRSWEPYTTANRTWIFRDSICPEVRGTTVSQGFWRFFACLLYILWIFAEFECLCLKTPKLKHFLRGVLIQSNPRPVSPIQSERKSRTVDHPKNTNNWFLCDIWGFVSSEKTTVAVCIFGNDTTLLHYNFQNDLRSPLQSVISPLVWPDQFSIVCTWREGNTRSIQMGVEKSYVLKTVRLYLSTHSIYVTDHTTSTITMADKER